MISKMNYEQQTKQLVLADEYRMGCLRVAREVGLPDWYLGAGFLRNAIWDHLHHKTEMTPLNDIDLVYFDNRDVSCESEQKIETQLKALFPQANWEVRNQARMHLRHGHQPYQNTVEGIRQWIEVPTCVGVRLEFDNQLTICAPFGLEENWSLKIKINPENQRPAVYRDRIKNKSWLQIWPKLTAE